MTGSRFGKRKKQKAHHEKKGNGKEIDRPLTNRKKKGKKAASKKLAMSLKAASSSCSSATSSNNGNTIKSQCDICKLSYISQAKLTEHLVSLIHHTKLENAQENPSHECILCQVSYSDMSSYREHIGTSKHLRKLEGIRTQDNSKEKGNQNKNLSQNKRTENQSGQFKPHSNNSGWQASKYQHSHLDGSNYQDFQNWNQNNNNFHLSNRPNFNQDGQRRNVSWGSGAIGFRQPAPYGYNRYQDNDRFNYHHNNNNDRMFGFPQENFEPCWDEQSFQQHEDFLANMDHQGYPGDYHPDSSHYNGWQHQSQHPFEYPGNRHGGFDPYYNNQRGRSEGSTSHDRKRARYEDYPVESVAKSYKPHEKDHQSTNDNDDGLLPTPHDGPSNKLSHTSTAKDPESNRSKPKDSQRKNDETTSQDKSSLDNASDSILERAERLCKELREKREASYAQRASIIKSQNHQSVNDKMNTLKKSQQSYLKGHIKSPDKEQPTSKTDNAVSSTSSASSSLLSSSVSPSIKTSSSQKEKTSVSSAKVKTLEEIRNSIEQSVREDIQNTAATQNKIPLRRRTISASSPGNESSLSKSSEQEVRQGKPTQKSDSISISSSKTGGSKTLTKPSITKENLNKMVNCPRSRTERVQLARMFQSRGDSRSAANNITTRANINMEGLYDNNLEGLNGSSTVSDIQLNVGEDMATIKLEELSDDVRNQILNLIQDDFSSTCDEQQQVEVENHISKEKRPKKASDSNVKDVSAAGKSSVEREEKNPISTSKSSKRNKVSSDDVADVISNLGCEAPDLVSGIEKPGSHSAVTQDSSVRDFGTTNNRPDRANSALQSHDDHDKSLLTSDNILNRFPTIMSSVGSKTDKNNDLHTTADEGKDVRCEDSGRSSMLSLAMPVLQLSSASSRDVYLPPALLSPKSSMGSSLDCLPSTYPSGAELSSNLRAMGNSLSTQGESTSNTVSELLTLSEKEELIKQEMTNMELRLTRLHRLLEQAVNQINKCTERRNQLQDEEKNLTSQRLALLREAAASSSFLANPGLHSSASSVDTATRPSSVIGGVPASHTLVATTPSNGTPKAMTTDRLSLQSSVSGLGSSLPESLSVESGSRPESSLSRSEWLAKFSAYLPSDPLVVSSKESAAPAAARPSLSSTPTTIGLSLTQTQTASSSLSTSSLQPQPLALSRGSSSSLRMVPERDYDAPMYRDGSKYQGATYVSDNIHRGSDSHNLSMEQDTSAGSSNPLTAEFTSPIMYVGTIKGDNALNNKGSVSAPVMMLDPATISSLFKDGGGGGEHANDANPIRLRFSAEEQNLSKEPSIPPAPYKPSLTSPRQDDSDIGSVASVASGSSLGEQISRYCRFTPGASMDGRNPHELSIILSGPSDTSELKEVEDHHDSADLLHVEMDDSRKRENLARLKDTGNNRLYGRLDQDSIKSAEALHLLERNNEVPSTSTRDKKKKKRKTKQERDSGLRGRVKDPYVISSSSGEEFENVATGKGTETNDVSSLEKRLRKSPGSTSEDADSDNDFPPPVSVNLSTGTAIGGLDRSSSLSPGKTEITVAECDSSTSLGMVDTQSLNERSSRLKEMNVSFEKNFGRKPKYVDSKHGRSSGKGEGCVVVLSDSEEQTEMTNSVIVDLCSDDYDCRTPKGLINGSYENSSRFPGDFGPVCFVQVFQDKLYAGFLHYGFRILPLSENGLTAKSIAVPKLVCMAVTLLLGEDKVFVGAGDRVVSYKMANGSTKSVDVGTTVKCLHILRNTLFVGLDTGEIYEQDVKTCKQKNRYICSDCAIHCISSGSEGGTMILCVSSQDSTITVVDADRSLPLRILVGHSKTAFSVQVHDQYVYSGAGDGTTVVHNLHTARVEKVHKDNKGIVNCVFYSSGYLFTGGMDRLVRCYNAKNHKLVQVYYGADKGAVKSIYYVHQNKTLITGNSLGSIDVVTLDFKAKHVCKHKRCGLNFGLAAHLAWHIEHEHLSTF